MRYDKIDLRVKNLSVLIERYKTIPTDYTERKTKFFQNFYKGVFLNYNFCKFIQKGSKNGFKFLTP